MADGEPADATTLGGAAGGPANPPEPPGLWVRATINWRGLHAGQVVYIEPDMLDHPWAVEGLEHLWIVSLPGQEIL